MLLLRICFGSALGIQRKKGTALRRKGFRALRGSSILNTVGSLSILSGPEAGPLYFQRDWGIFMGPEKCPCE